MIFWIEELIKIAVAALLF